MSQIKPYFWRVRLLAFYRIRTNKIFNNLLTETKVMDKAQFMLFDLDTIVYNLCEFRSIASELVNQLATTDSPIPYTFACPFCTFNIHTMFKTATLNIQFRSVSCTMSNSNPYEVNQFNKIGLWQTFWAKIANRVIYTVPTLCV